VKLLWVVEVDQSRRVMCSAPGCGHSVFKKIHICRTADGIRLFGSACFNKLIGFGEELSSTPRYGTGEGRKLTDDERRELLDNTEEFIRRISDEVEAQEQLLAAQVAAQAERRSQELEQQRRDLQERLAAMQLQLQRQQEAIAKPRPLRFETWRKTLNDEEKAAYSAARRKVEEHMKKKYGIDPTLAGWVGWVNCDARRMVESGADIYASEIPASPARRTTNQQANFNM
jgi:hypothetical protein